MKKTSLIQRVLTILGISVLTFFSLACPEEFIDEIQIENQQGKALVSLSVTDTDTARTILPQVSL